MLIDLVIGALNHPKRPHFPKYAENNGGKEFAKNAGYNSAFLRNQLQKETNEFLYQLYLDLKSQC